MDALKLVPQVKPVQFIGQSSRGESKGTSAKDQQVTIKVRPSVVFGSRSCVVLLALVWHVRLL